MSTRAGRAIAAMAGVVVLAGAGVFAFQRLAGGGPAPVSLSKSPPVTLTPGGGSGSSGSASGSWTVRSGSPTFVGYRVREKLAELPASSDAVGRSPAVGGSLTIAGSKVTAVKVSADLRQLSSDRERRDNSIRSRGLETASFPTASFALASPLELGGAPAIGKVVKATAVGDLTLHGITRRVTFPVQARWNGDTIEVAGTLPIQFADYQISPPDFAGFVTVEDHGQIELNLIFQRA